MPRADSMPTFLMAGALQGTPDESGGPEIYCCKKKKKKKKKNKKKILSLCCRCAANAGREICKNS